MRKSPNIFYTFASDLQNGTIIIEAFESPASVARPVAKRAKQRRTAMRLTQAELAQKAGLSLSAYRRF